MPHGPTRSWRSGQKNSFRSPVRTPRYGVACEETFHRVGNFDDVRFYSKMAGIQELDPRTWYVLSKCLRSRGDKKRVVLTPNRQQRRLHLPKIILERWVE